MPMNKSFNIAMPNKPYVEDFSEGKVQAATYTGPRYLKVQYHNDTKYIANIINEGDTMEDLNEGPSAVMENHTSTVIDADSDTLVAAYLNNMYETGEVADYSEDLGTTDDNGDAETWEYVWNDYGVMHQIYLQGTAKFENNLIKLQIENDRVIDLEVRANVVGLGTTTSGISTFRFSGSDQPAGSERSGRLESGYVTVTGAASTIYNTISYVDGYV